MTTSGSSRQRFVGVVFLALLLVVVVLAVPATSSFLRAAPHEGSSDLSLMVSPGPGGAAVTELFAVYNARADLQAAFPNASTNTSNANYHALVSWAASMVSGAWADSSYSALALFGYNYELMATYNARADLQAAFPNAYTNGTSYHALVSWAAGVVSGAWADSSYSTLAPFGYYYALMGTYNERADLQTAFPHAYTNATNYHGLVSWAGAVVERQWGDSAYTTLDPYGYYYALMATYNARADLQAAFPNAYTSFVAFTGLVNWAGGVVNTADDSAFLTLFPFGYYYDLMNVYNGRADLEYVYPTAYTNWGQYEAIAYWAGEVVNGTIPIDPSQLDLQAYGYWYVLYGWVYANRGDLQAAFPIALTEGGSNQGLMAWASGVVQRLWPDSSYSTLLPYASTYEALG